MRHRTLVALSLLLAACKPGATTGPDDNSLICTAQAVPALNVRVLDSLSRQPLAFVNLWARARDGSYMDSLLVPQTLATNASYHFYLAYERPGTYDITVKAQGWQAWTKTGVVVTADPCHVKEVALDALLRR